MKILFTILYFLLYYCLYSQPVISSFFPEAGPTGALVKINGSGFSSNAKDNIVFFGAVRATVTAAASASISAIVPPSASYQPITVTTAGLTAYARKPFSVIFNCGIFNANTFPVRTDNAAPNYTLSMAVKDLDNDGKPEIITGGYGFSIFKNTSSINSFSLQPSLTWGNSQFNEYIIVDDMDGDGMPDVIVPNWTPNDTSSIYVLKNTSGGGAISFDSPVKSYTKGGYGIVTSDLDGDGKPDIASSGESSPFLSIQRNTTTGGILSFAPEIIYSADNYSRGVAIGYIDADDKPDILVANQSNQSFSVFINHSTPGNILFSPKINFSTTPGGSPESVTVADVDGDGKSDVVVTNNNSFSVNTISVFRNISNGGTVAFDTRLDLTTDNKWNNYHLAISDIDGDGKPDIASNNQFNSLISLFRNTSTIGSCSFEPKLDITSASYTRRPVH